MGIAARGAAGGVLETVEAAVADARAVMAAGEAVLLAVWDVTPAAVMAAWETVMVIAREALTVNAMDVLEAVPLVAGGVLDVMAVAAAETDAPYGVVVDAVVDAIAVREAVLAVPAVRAAQAVAAAVAETAGLHVRMHVPLSARRQPVGAAEAHVLPAALEAVETLVHQTASPAVKIAARPPAHRPAIPPARTSASAVRNNNR